MSVYKSILGGLRRHGEEGPEVSREGDALVIDCRGCGFTPVPGSEECVRCMVESMASTGGADRIVLRTGRDMEVSGAAAGAVREIASIRRWSSTTEHLPGRCAVCGVSRRTVMEAAWAGFPRSTVFEGRKLLRDGAPDRESCVDCVMRTSRALDQVESGLAGVVRELKRQEGTL